jgi:hypothetical protein
MTDKPSRPTTHAVPPAAETELHASVEGLQVQVRALASAIDHLCRAVEAAAPDASPPSPEVSSAIENARQSLGEIW